MVHGYGDNDIHLMGVIATCNPKLAGAREMAIYSAIKYIKESEDIQILGDGVWALRRRGGTTVVVIYGVKRKDSRKMRVLLPQREYLYRIRPALKGADSLGVRCPSEKD
jgi:hypothetical protein